MPESLSSPLADAASETLESLAYCFAERVDASAVPAADVDGVVAVAFAGEAHGGVVLQLSGGILPTMAGNMLGRDEPTSPDDQRDALGEAANVICGNVLPRVAGLAAVFALGVPQHFPTWQAALDVLGTPHAHVSLDVEGGRADVALVMHPSA
jgi:CheY-specific phosphatase CheX